MATTALSTIKSSKSLKEYVEREEKRKAFRQDGICAWKEYRATGLHVSHEEVDAWLANLEQGQDREIPACHV